jgi:hypothetical protein
MTAMKHAVLHQPTRLPSATPAIWVGCAGWALSSKVADLFLTEGSHLERYAQVFSCVEINSSFYRPHQARTYARWADSVPDATGSNSVRTTPCQLVHAARCFPVQRSRHFLRTGSSSPHCR